MLQKKANNSKTIKVISQNLRGLKSEVRLEELFTYILRFGVFAACLQETWRFENEELQNSGCVLLTAGLKRNENVKRGSQGVGIVLSRSAVSCWEEAGCEVHRDFGARVIAVRMVAKDSRNADISLFLVSAYAPVSTSSEETWSAYYEQLQDCIDRRRPGDILLIGTDSNASIGVQASSDGEGYTPVGRCGIDHINQSGRRFRNFLAVNNLVSATTCFQKKNYGTWQHPRSKKLHQLDHVIVCREKLKCLLDAGITTTILDSDHRAIRCKLRLQLKMKKKTDARSKLTHLDYSGLKDTDTASMFCLQVKENIISSTNADLESSLKNAAENLLPKKSKPQPGWFQMHSTTLQPLIDARNSAMEACMSSKRLRSQTLRLRNARKNLKKAVEDAKNQWVKEHCSQLNDSMVNARGTRPAWEAIGKLKAGMSKTKPSTVKIMKKPDGSICTTPEENAEVFKNHFADLFGRPPTFDASVLDLLDQHETAEGLDHTPSDEEIEEAVTHLRNTAPGESGLPASVYKCLLNTPETFQIIKDIVHLFWETGAVPSEWEKGLLKILPKKGDLTQAGNYRGIMLLEVAYKIIANLLKKRLTPIEESLDHETQCGFRPGRGCTDAVFTVKTALKKRREHGLETWVLFLDLVKAFDRVPREMLWLILKKFGVPEKLIFLLKALHENVLVKFEVQGITHSVNSIIGVKQGDILGPILFTFHIAAVMITWRKTFSGDVCLFRSKEDFILTGRRHDTVGEEFPLTDSEFADDTAALFTSRRSVENDVPLLYNHFARFGMEVHKGNVPTEKKSSKTEILFCANHYTCTTILRRTMTPIFRMLSLEMETTYQ